MTTKKVRAKKPTPSNMTFVDIPLHLQKADDRNTPLVSAVSTGLWKGKPLFVILHDAEPRNQYTSPEVRPWFIRTSQEDNLRMFYGYAASLDTAKALCELKAREFEAFLTSWHNTPRIKNVEIPSTPEGLPQS